jgi:integrase
VTNFGKPYTAAGFGNWFRDLTLEAGCPGLSPHGLRKATATMLAELGCSDKQIAAILGHTSSGVVNIYTRAADQKRLTREAMRKRVEAGK